MLRRFDLRTRIAAGLTAVTMAWTMFVCRTAAAQNDPPSTFRSVAGCPSEAELRERIARDEDNVRFDVRLERLGPQHYGGRLHVRPVGASASAERALESSTCQEIVEALVVIASLSIEAAHADDDRDFSPRPKAVRGPGGTLDSGPEYGLVFPTEPSRRPSRPFLFRWFEGTHVVFGVHMGVASGVSRGVLTVLDGFIGFEELAAIRLGIATSPADAKRTSESASLVNVSHWYSIYVDACPPSVDLLGIRLGACGRFESHFLNGSTSFTNLVVSGDAVFHSHSNWAALALPIRLRRSLSQRFFFELEATPRFSIPGQAFEYFPGRTERFDPGGFSFSTSAGIGIALP